MIETAMPFARRHTAILLMLINTLCWGAALPFVKPALELTTPYQHLFMRYIIAGGLTFPVIIWYLYKQPLLWKSLPRIFALETLGTVITLSLLYEGLSRTSALHAGIITTAAPVFIVLGGVFFLGERQKKREWLGLLLSLSGTLLLTIYSSWQDLGAAGSLLLFGNILLMGQNISDATFFLAAKKNYTPLPKIFVTAVSFWVGMIGFALLSMVKLRTGPITFLLDTSADFTQPPVAFAALYMAIFGSIIGLTTYIAGQNLMEASEASLFRYLQPLVYVPLAVFFLHEPFDRLTALALLIITSGVLIARYEGALRAPTQKAALNKHKHHGVRKRLKKN